MNSVIAAIIAAVRIFMIWAFAWLPSDFRFANDISADILELHPLSKSASKLTTKNPDVLNFYNSKFASKGFPLFKNSVIGTKSNHST